MMNSNNNNNSTKIALSFFSLRPRMAGKMHDTSSSKIPLASRENVWGKGLLSAIKGARVFSAETKRKKTMTALR